MSKLRSLVSLVVLSAATVWIGCSDRSPTSPEASVDPAEVVASIGASVPDVSGAWSWSSVERLKMEPFVAMAVGVVPEGKSTHARCESAGTMTLTQSGATFEGVAEKTSNACLTRGGQPFQQPESAFFVEDGRITGASARFSFASATVRPCPHNAVIAEVSGGVALELSGSGLCFLPNHPRSESPLDLPPPAGTTTTLSWTAVR